MSLSRGRRVKRKMMNETDLHSIHQFEYYIDFQKHRIWARILGFVLFLAAIGGAYVNFANILIAFPVYPYSEIGNYAALGLIAIIGLIMWLRVGKTLYVKIKSGLNDVSTLALEANKYNELTARYLGSKIHPIAKINYKRKTESNSVFFDFPFRGFEKHDIIRQIKYICRGEI